MTETVQEYMMRRQREAQAEVLARKYRAVANSKDAEDLQKKNVALFERHAKWWRRGCGLDDD